MNPLRRTERIYGDSPVDLRRKPAQIQTTSLSPKRHQVASVSSYVRLSPTSILQSLPLEPSPIGFSTGLASPRNGPPPPGQPNPEELALLGVKVRDFVNAEGFPKAPVVLHRRDELDRSLKREKERKPETAEQKYERLKFEERRERARKKFGYRDNRPQSMNIEQFELTYVPTDPQILADSLSRDEDYVETPLCSPDGTIDKKIEDEVPMSVDPKGSPGIVNSDESSNSQIPLTHENTVGDDVVETQLVTPDVQIEPQSICIQRCSSSPVAMTRQISRVHIRRAVRLHSSLPLRRPSALVLKSLRRESTGSLTSARKLKLAAKLNNEGNHESSPSPSRDKRRYNLRTAKNEALGLASTPRTLRNRAAVQRAIPNSAPLPLLCSGKPPVPSDPEHTTRGRSRSRGRRSGRASTRRKQSG